MASNPFDQFDTAPVARGGFIPLGTPSPKFQYEGPAAAADLQRTQMGIAKDAATLPYDRRIAAAKAQKDEADAQEAQRKADEGRANAAIASMAPTSNLHGEAYFDAIKLPEGQRALARAYARGDLGSRAGGLTTSMLPIIQHAMNYDPSTSATTFPARVKMQQDLAGSQPGTAGGALRAMERMLLHGREVLRSGQSLDNYGPGLLGTIGNAVRTGYERHTDNAGINNYEELVKNYAPEAQRAIAQTSGGQAERQDRAEGFGASKSQASRAAALQADTKQAFDAASAVNGQYKRLMGHDITDQLSPDAKAAYHELMAGGYGAKGEALYPAAGYTPPTTPPNGTPGSPPTNPVGGAGGGGQTLATGATRTVNDAGPARAIEALLKAGTSNADIRGAFPDRSFSDDQLNAGRAYFQKHPTASGVVNATHQEANGLLARAVASPVGTGIASALDQVVPFGVYGKDAVQGLKAAKAQNPLSADLGDLVGLGGAVAAAGGLEAGLSHLAGSTTGLTSRLLANPLTADAIYGSAVGAAGNTDNRFEGAALGAGVGAGGGAVGRFVAKRPFVADGLNRVAGIFGRGLNRVNDVSAPNAEILNRAGGDSASDVLGALDQARRLGVPMSLADASAPLNSLAGAVVRRSPNAAQIAENAFLPRAQGQIDRFGMAVTRDLGPIANIPQIRDDMLANARTAARPHYDAYRAAPGASAVDLSDLSQRPSMQAGLKQAAQTAKEAGVDPTSLGFGLTDQGEVTLGRTPSFDTLDQIKRGLDDVLETHRNPLTNKLDLSKPNERALNDTRAELVKRIDAVNPHYSNARAAYAGPASARSALDAGTDAFKLTPDELAMQVSAQTPANLPQMQLGFRSEMMNRANAVRDASNPFEATLGAPAARARVDALYPGNAGTANLFAQRDLERALARSQNSILGNSMTAQRQLADQAFATSPALESALHAGAAVATHGASIPGTAARFLGGNIKDITTLGLGKRAVARADDLAPTLFNTDPAQASQTLMDLIAQRNAYRRYINDAAPTRIGGILGAGLPTVSLLSN